MHAFLGWFDVSFRACHKPVSFSTGPHAKYTHCASSFLLPGVLADPTRLAGKQTVFYLRDMLTVNQGEVVEGTISVRPNQKNHRDLDIDIGYQLDGELPGKGQLSYKMCVPISLPIVARSELD